jgi:hypothetical protein
LARLLKPFEIKPVEIKQEKKIGMGISSPSLKMSLKGISLYPPPLPLIKALPLYLQLTMRVLKEKV